MSHELFGPQGLQCCVSAVGRSVPSILGWRLRCAVQRWSCGGLGQCGLRRVRASDWAENCWTWDGKKDKLEENLGIWRWIFRKEHGSQTLKTMFFFSFQVTKVADYCSNNIWGCFAKFMLSTSKKPGKPQAIGMKHWHTTSTIVSFVIIILLWIWDHTIPYYHTSSTRTRRGGSCLMDI